MRTFLAAAVVLLLSAPLLAAAEEGTAAIISEPLTVADAGQYCPPTPSSCESIVDEEVYHLVPVRKKVYEEETYLEEVTQSRIEREVRTKVVRGNSPRLVRSGRNDGYANIQIHKDPHREKTYTKPIKVEYTVPVMKTRKVATEVEEYELVPERKRGGKRR